MISYFNYEINHNLEKLKKLKLLNNKKLNKKFIEKDMEIINPVNNLPKNNIPITFHSREIVEIVENNNFHIKEDNLNSKIDNELKKDYEKLDLTNSHDNFLNNFDINKHNPPTSFLGNNIIEEPFDNNFININVMLKNLKNKTIHNVYQYKYINNSVTGFGDFLRSIYFMLQFSEKYGLKFEIDINKHNIKKYLEHFKYKKDLEMSIQNNISMFDKSNYKQLKINNIIDYTYNNIDEELVYYLNYLDNYNNHIYLYLINHPNKNNITELHKNYVKNIIKPTQELNNYIDKFLFNLHLQKNNYIVIHIRYFDEPICEIDSQFLGRMNYIIKNIIYIKNKYKIDIVLFTSQNIIKNYIIKYLPYIKTHFNPICHTCDYNAIDETIINTLKDFYIMSYSKAIYSFSVYEHGSGFSQWCAITYNIPYICYSIQ